MKGNEIFSGKSLKAEDLNGVEPVVTIDSVTVKKFDDGSRKPVISFKGKEKTLVCNKTNWNAIVEITGEDDSDNWSGHRIKLIVAKVEFQGKRVPAIRIEEVAQAKKAKPAAVPVEDDFDGSDDPDSVPF